MTPGRIHGLFVSSCLQSGGGIFYVNRAGGNSVEKLWDRGTWGMQLDGCHLYACGRDYVAKFETGSAFMGGERGLYSVEVTDSPGNWHGLQLVDDEVWTVDPEKDVICRLDMDTLDRVPGDKNLRPEGADKGHALRMHVNDFVRVDGGLYYSCFSREPRSPYNAGHGVVRYVGDDGTVVEYAEELKQPHSVTLLDDGRPAWCESATGKVTVGDRVIKTPSYPRGLLFLPREGKLYVGQSQQRHDDGGRAGILEVSLETWEVGDFTPIPAGEVYNIVFDGPESSRLPAGGGG